MNAQFITNQHKFLSEIINGILPKSIQADILVGYFYFSGFEQIYKQVESKCVRVLVGLDIDTEIINRVREVDYHTEINQSRGQQKRDYYHSLVQLFNETDYFDSSEKTEAFTLFYHKIKEGTLEIRKTKEPCHAKMYLFTYSDSVNEMGEEPGTVITGSSNLSRSGLKERLEINARFTNKAVYHEAKGIFDNLWKDAIIIADKEHIEEFDSNVIERIWIDKLYSPYTFYIRVLQEYFSLNFQGNFKNASDITGGKFFDLKYQSDAIKMALSTIETHSGVIVSDVVGLGKSIIGSAVVHNLNLKTIIVAPPHLVSQWDGYKSDFHFSATVFSSGSISKALEFYQHHKTFNEKWLIILDEAHKYRNEYTQDYADLHKLCKNNKVLLLTATPFNNKPQDIYSMIKLFQIPSHSTLQTVNNLGKEFRSLISQYAALTRREKNKKKRTADEIKKEADKIAARIRTIIEPLVIRRSRLDLEAISTYREDLKKQGIEFPRVAEPRLMEYSLGALKDLYLKTLNKLSPHTDEEGNPDTDAPYFKAARYQPVKYVKAARTEHLKKRIEEAGFEYNLFLGTQSNMSKFMRYLLVRRFESSIEAFRNSLEYIITSSNNVLNWMNRYGKVPIYKKGYLPDIDAWYSDSSDDLNQHLTEEGVELELAKLKKKGLFEIDLDDLTDDFRRDIEEDIALLKQISIEWFGTGTASRTRKDAKLESFKEILLKQLASEPKRKIIVFSEFADTVDYVYRELQAAGLPVFRYTSAIASYNNKEVIKSNFDAGIKNTLQANDYKILIATDAISEGYNLHRAGAIFNYDIPYNPTRVIQRVGRINRMNKKVFDELYIYNYFPTEIGEKETRGKEISTLKMAMIHAIMGEDTKVLTKEEELKSYFKEKYERELQADESLSWDTPYKELLDTIKAKEAYYDEAMRIPHRARIRRKTNRADKGVIVFGKKGTDFIFKMGNGNEVVTLTPEDAFRIFEATVLEQPHKISGRFEPIYKEVCKSLFALSKDNETEKIKRNAIDKVCYLMKNNTATVSSDYLKDLLTVIETDSLSGHSLRFINKLTQKEIHTLPQEIDQDYLDRILQTIENVENGKEMLILSEEIQ